MLVIVSDIHLTDGSSGETVHQGALRVFRDRLRNLAYAASWRADGSYRPIDQIDVVLLGDILDILRSSRWLEDRPGVASRVRPWNAPASTSFIDKIQSILDAILARNRVFFTILREMHGGAACEIPRQIRGSYRPLNESVDGRPNRIHVPLKIHYMTGNHDWFLHLPHPEYHAIRRVVVEKLGLANDSEAPFPHDVAEPGAEVLRRTMEAHRVFARHGDIYDPLNFEGCRDRASLGDAIVIELVTRFAIEVKRKLGDVLPESCLRGANELDNVRPLLMVPGWIAGLLRQASNHRKTQRQVQGIWNELVDEFMKNPFVRARCKASRNPVEIEKFKWALRTSKALLSPQGRRLLRWLAERGGNRSFCGYALEESQFRKRKASYIVYGHTHRHELSPLDGAWNSEPARMYLNSGTWRPVHELTRLHPGIESFASFHAMTYLAFFKDDERGGRAFECWSGSIAESKTGRSALPSASC